MITHDRWIAENTASDRHRLHGNTFQRSSTIVSEYMETLQRSGDRRQLSAILRFSDSSDPAIASDYLETRFKAWFPYDRLGLLAVAEACCIFVTIVNDHMETRCQL